MDAKEEVRARLAIEDVIGEYVQLKRAGRNWKGLSPFGSEKTPSFVVSPDKGIWHDFSSGRGGDMFSFIMEMEGLEFRQALELLARRAGVDIEQYRGNSNSSSKSKERLYECLELATKFYQTQFSKSKVAYEYVLGKRGFSKETALTWRLGYSPNNGTALVDFLQKRGFTEQEIKLAGLSSKNYRGLGDMFRGRLQIPLCDGQGRVVGFTARLLADDPKAPKYINTPSTPLYDKSRHVFGLHLAKEAIRKTGFVVLAEGNLDVISSHQAGVRQVVATAGTALTEPHLKALNRLTGDIRLCFDADKAGIAATERAIPVASKVGVSLQVVTIPAGKDPDELVRQDVDVWKRVIEQPQYVADWLIDRYTATLDITTAQGKRQLSDVVLAVIRQLSDSVERDHYLGKLADLLQVNKAALVEKLAQGGSTTDRPLRRAKKDATQVTLEENSAREATKTEENFIALVLMQPKLREYLYPLTPELFRGEHTREVFVFLQEHPDFDGSNSDEVKKIAEYGKILSLIYETLYQDIEALELHNEAARLQHKLIREYVRTEKQALVAQLQNADSATASKLLERVGELDKLLKDY
ncbi:MAG: primase [Patescibacteria group bacterium]|nr:DNA primase [Candidatus Saccharibacteria bacterium]MDQ5963367.1 primase [Patescibacteria group bacterium]